MKTPSRDAYIFDRGNCKECGEHKPVNIYRVCERCDKLADPSKDLPVLEFTPPHDKSNE